MNYPDSRHCQRERHRATSLLESVTFVFALCLQRVPGGGGGGTSTQSKRHGWNPALLSSSYPLPKRHTLKFPVLLHCSVSSSRHPLPSAVHRRRQQDLQRLLERPAAAPEELQHLLPGCQHSQWGEWFRSPYILSYLNILLLVFFFCVLLRQIKNLNFQKLTIFLKPRHKWSNTIIEFNVFKSGNNILPG